MFPCSVDDPGNVVCREMTYQGGLAGIPGPGLLWPPTSPQFGHRLGSRWAVAATLSLSGLVWWANVGRGRAVIYRVPPIVPIESSRGRSLLPLDPAAPVPLTEERGELCKTQMCADIQGIRQRFLFTCQTSEMSNNICKISTETAVISRHPQETAELTPDLGYRMLQDRLDFCIHRMYLALTHLFTKVGNSGSAKLTFG